MANDTTTTELFCCDCGQAEHFMFVDHYHWGPSPEYPPEFSMRVHLNHNRPLLQRLKTAALYLMGKKGKHGAFDSLILGTGDVKRLRASCDAFLVADWEQEKAQAAEVIASEGTFWSDETRAEAWQWLKDHETSPSTPAGKYEPREATPVVMVDEWPEGDPDVLKDIRDKLNPLLVKRFEGMNTREVYDALQQDAYEQAIMKLSDEEIAVLKTVWKVED